MRHGSSMQPIPEVDASYNDDSLSRSGSPEHVEKRSGSGRHWSGRTASPSFSPSSAASSRIEFTSSNPADMLKEVDARISYSLLVGNEGEYRQLVLSSLRAMQLARLDVSYNGRPQDLAAASLDRFGTGEFGIACTLLQALVDQPGGSERPVAGKSAVVRLHQAREFARASASSKWLEEAALPGKRAFGFLAAVRHRASHLQSHPQSHPQSDARGSSADEVSPLRPDQLIGFTEAQGALPYYVSSSKAPPMRRLSSPSRLPREWPRRRPDLKARMSTLGDEGSSSDHGSNYNKSMSDLLGGLEDVDGRLCRSLLINDREEQARLITAAMRIIKRVCDEVELQTDRADSLADAAVSKFNAGEFGAACALLQTLVQLPDGPFYMIAGQTAETRLFQAREFARASARSKWIETAAMPRRSAAFGFLAAVRERANEELAPEVQAAAEVAARKLSYAQMRGGSRAAPESPGASGTLFDAFLFRLTHDDESQLMDVRKSDSARVIAPRRFRAHTFLAGTRRLKKDQLRMLEVKAHANALSCLPMGDSGGGGKDALRMPELARCFSSLHAAVRERRQARIALSCCVLHMSKRQLSRSMRAWVAAVAATTATREVVRRHCAALLNHDAQAAFSLWRSHAAQRKRRALQLAQAVRRMRSVSVGPAWRAWACQRNVRARNLDVAQHVLMRILQRELARCWQTWDAARRSRARQMQLLRKGTGFLRSRELASCFYTWRGAGSARRALQAQASGAQGTMPVFARRKLCSAWLLWNDQLSQAASLKERRQTMELHLRKRRRARCMREWAALSRKQSHEHQLLLRGAACFSRDAAYAKFSAWKASAIHTSSYERKQRLAASRLRWLQQGRSLRQWRAICLSAQQERHLLRCASTYLSVRELAVAMRCWQAVASYAQQTQQAWPDAEAGVDAERFRQPRALIAQTSPSRMLVTGNGERMLPTIYFKPSKATRWNASEPIYFMVRTSIAPMPNQLEIGRWLHQAQVRREASLSGTHRSSFSSEVACGFAELTIREWRQLVYGCRVDSDLKSVVIEVPHVVDGKVINANFQGRLASVNLVGSGGNSAFTGVRTRVNVPLTPVAAAQLSQSARRSPRSLFSSSGRDANGLSPSFRHENATRQQSSMPGSPVSKHAYSEHEVLSPMRFKAMRKRPSRIARV